MDGCLKGYCKFVEKIEKERNEIRTKYYSKNIFQMLFRKSYKKMLDNYDDLLIHCYEFIGKQIEED